MHPYHALLAAATLMNALAAGWVLAMHPRRHPNQRVALLVGGAAFWAACELAWNRAANADDALAWMRASALGWCYLGPVALDTFLGVIEHPARAFRRLRTTLYVTSTGLLLAAWTTPLLMARAVPTAWGWGFEVGPLFSVFYAQTLLGVGAAFLAMRTYFRATPSPAERRQRSWVVVGSLLPSVVASTTDALLPMLGVQVLHLGTTAFAVLGLLAVLSALRFGYSLLTPGSFSDQMLEALPEGVILVHPDGRIRRVNPSLARLSGYAARDLGGTPLAGLLPAFSGAPETDILGLESELRRRDGTRTPVSVCSTLLCDRQDYPLGHVVVVRDLREVSELRRRVVRSARLAAMGELAAGIAHEINNPLAFVRSNLSLLEDHWKAIRTELHGGGLGPDGVERLDESRDLIGESLEGVDRAAEVVRGVRGFAHGGSGEREPTDINALLDDVLRMARPQFAQGAHHATVERAYGGVPQVTCNPQELKHVFLNLIVNAIQAIDDGGVVRLRTEARPGAVVVHVEDDGPGISPENLDRIFDPFFTTKPVGEGTGLGLGIAYQIVRNHDGDLEVDSTPGRGTCVRVVLPAGG